MIRLALLGDVRLNREGLALLLARDSRLRVAASSGTAVTLPDRGASIDVIVVGAGCDGNATAVAQLLAGARAPAVVLGTPEQERDVVMLAELGVMGFVESEASLDELISTVVSVAMGDAMFPPRIATMLLRRVSTPVDHRFSEGASSLTARERQIVELIAEGLSNKEIAAELCIEVATVKNHVHNILEKLQVSRRSDAVARLRLIEGGGSEARVSAAFRSGTTTRSRAG